MICEPALQAYYQEALLFEAVPDLWPGVPARLWQHMATAPGGDGTMQMVETRQRRSECGFIA